MMLTQDAIRAMSMEELTACIGMCSHERDSRRDTEIASLREHVKTKANQIGVSVHDIFNIATKHATKKAKIKYRDEHGNEWSGRGIQPLWLRAHIESGRSADEFLV